MHHKNLWLLSGGAPAGTRAPTLLSLVSIPHPLLVVPVSGTQTPILSGFKSGNGVRTGQQTRKENSN